MKIVKLATILKGITYECIEGNLEKEVNDLIYDSREVKEDTAFFCMPGVKADGHIYAESAMEKGANVIVAERKIPVKEGVTLLVVPSTRKALSYMSANFFGNPGDQLFKVGITGTKGKTTTSHIIRRMLDLAGLKYGIIGTIGAFVGDELIPLKHTTPESYVVQKLFRRMVDAGCQYVVMEVSSQGLKMDRVACVNYDIGVFTNLTPDHIGKGEHESFEEYLYCKSLLFNQCKLGLGNIDDEHYDKVTENAQCPMSTFGLSEQAQLRGMNIEHVLEHGHLKMKFTTSGIINDQFVVNIPGKFNVYNALCAIDVAQRLGISTSIMQEALDTVEVKGRVEPMKVSDDFTLLIDYAHNEVSTRSLLTMLTEYEHNHIICIYGCGGNRSKLRRYDMGEVIGEMADLSILTCDNPRDEEIKDINEDIKVGLAKSNGKYIEIEDRTQAIVYALQNAKKGDMIVLIGKGHETYQEIKGVKYHYDEREAVMEAINIVNNGKETAVK